MEFLLFPYNISQIKTFRKIYISYEIINAEGGVLIIKYIKESLAIVIILLSLFTVKDYENKKQIQFMSNKIVELEKDNKYLNSEIAELKKGKEELNLEIEELKTNNKNLIESNDILQKESIDLKKKLETAKANNQAATNKEADKIAYLTFDDGPSDNTIKILDILKENNIKATFFVNGNPSRKELYERIVIEGHTIGNHTYSHDYASLYKTIAGFNQDKQKLEDFVFSITGVKPQVLRFPGGSNNQVSYKYGGIGFMDKLTNYEKQCGIKYFDWNVDSTDASVLTQDKAKIISEVLTGAKNKKQAIILMHDSKPKTTTAQALPDIIKGLKDEGFKFSTLSSYVKSVQFK